MLIIRVVELSNKGTKMKRTVDGCYIIEQQGNIMLVDSLGPFDESAAEIYHQDIKQATEEMSGDPWGSLITFRGNGVISPDAEHQLRETTQYRQQKGMIAIAVVILNSAYADLQQMQMQRIYQDCQIEFHVFSDRENASDWLNGYVAHANA